VRERPEASVYLALTSEEIEPDLLSLFPETVNFYRQGYGYLALAILLPIIRIS
jgi:hypothetical protein